MMLKSLSLKNVRSYGSCDIEFDSGTTLLIGDIGCGKSSILMAIEFALFGLGSYKPGALLSKGSSTCSVQMKFSAKGHEYEVYRSLKDARGKTGQDAKSAWISTDGTKDDTLGITEMKRKIIEILGMDEPGGAGAETSIFRYAVYTPQEDMKVVLSNPDKRKETIRRAFKIEGFAVARENAKKVNAEIKRTMKEHAIRFEGMEELEQKRSECENAMKSLKGKVSDMETEAANASGQVKNHEAKQSSAEKTKSRRDAALKNVSVLESQTGGLERTMDEARRSIERDLESVAKLEEKLDSNAARPDTDLTLRQADAEIAKLRKKSDELLTLLAKTESLESEIKSLTPGDAGDVESARASLSAMQEELDAARSAMSELSAKSNASKGMTRMLEENAKKLESEDSCPLCEQGIPDGHGKNITRSITARLKRARAEIKQTDSKIADMDASIRKRESTTATLTDELQAAKAARDALDVIASKSKELDGMKKRTAWLQTFKERLDEMETLRTRLADYEDSINDLKEARGSAKSLKQQITRQKSTVSADKDKLSKLEAKLAAEKAKFGEFAGLDGLIADVAESLRIWRQKESYARQCLAAARAELDGKAKSMQEYDARITECAKWKAGHARLGTYHDWMEKIFLPSVQVMEEQALESVRARFNRQYGEFYSMLLDDSSKESSIDSDFTPIMTEAGHEQSVVNLSGGEKTSVALAYRLTLAKMIRQDMNIPDGLLILDEPTDGFSKSQLEKVRTVLDNAGARQVILVSHDAELESYADRICRVTKTDGKSSVSA